MSNDRDDERSHGQGQAKRPVYVKSSDDEDRDKRPVYVKSSDDEDRDKRPVYVKSSDDEDRDKRPVYVKSSDDEDRDKRPACETAPADLARDKRPTKPGASLPAAATPGGDENIAKRETTWAVLVYAGPGAFEGLSDTATHEQSRNLATWFDQTLDSGRIQEELYFPADESRPPSLALASVTVAEPRLLELLTDDWKGQRQSSFAPDSFSADPSRGLGDFLRAAVAAHPAERYALVLLGDILRASASQDCFDEVWGFPDERSTRPVYVKSSDDEDRDKRPVYVKSSDDEDRDKRPVYVKSSDDEDRDKRPVYVKSSDDEDRDKRPVDERTAPQFILTAADEAGPKPPQRGSWRPESAGRVITRARMLVETIQAAMGGRKLALLATDTCDLSDVELAAEFAPHVDVLVSSQIESPRSAWPCEDLLLALNEQPALTPEALGRELVDRHDAAARTLARQCEALGEREGFDPALPRTRHLRRMLHAGSSAVALRCAKLPALVAAIEELGQRTADLVEHLEPNDPGLRLLRRCYRDANKRYAPRLQRCDLAEFTRVLTAPETDLPRGWQALFAGPCRHIRQLVCEPEHGVILHETHDRVRASLSGLSLTMPVEHHGLLSPFVADTKPWERVLMALHGVEQASLDPRRAQRIEAAVQTNQDLLAFIPDPGHPAGKAPQPATDPSRPWLMLHYLWANVADERVVRRSLRSLEKITNARPSLSRVQVEVAVDIPPVRSPRNQRSSWSLAGSLPHRLEPDERRALSLTGEARSCSNGTLRAQFERRAASYNPKRGELELLEELPSGEIYEATLARAPELILLDFSADGSKLIGITRFGDVHLWDLSTLEGDAAIPMTQLRLDLEEASLIVDLKFWRAQMVLEVETREADERDWLEAGSRSLDVAPSRKGRRDRERHVGSLNAFLARSMRDQSSPHMGLVIQSPKRPYDEFTIFDDDSGRGMSMTLPELATCLRTQLDAAGRDALDLLVLDSPDMLSLEIVHELRGVARVLAVPAGGGEDACPDFRLLLSTLDSQLDPKRGGLHAKARNQLIAKGLDRPYPTLERRWRDEVAKLATHAAIGAHNTPVPALAPKQSAAGDLADVLAPTNFEGRLGFDLFETLRAHTQDTHDEHHPLHFHAFDLTRVDELTRHFNALCRILFDTARERAVWAALNATFVQEKYAPVRSFGEVLTTLERKLEANSDSPTRTRLLAAIRRVKAALEQVWIGPPGDLSFYCPVEEAGERASYLELGFHRQTYLYPLLSSFRLINTSPPHVLWDIISTSIAHSSGTGRRKLLERLTGGREDGSIVRRQFASIATPPSLSLSLEAEGGPGRYQLRLSSSESAALLLQQHSRVNPQTIEQALEGLDYLLARSDVSDSRWAYLESLGASLGEDIIGSLHARLESERLGLQSLGTSDDVHLSLRIPRALMRYPWELMTVPVNLLGDNRKQMLCERFAIGRQIWSDGGRTRPPRDHDLSPLRVLIVGDPTLRAGGSQLPGARAEAEAIAQAFATIHAEFGSEEFDFHPRRDVFIGKTVTRASLRRLLRDGGYDIVHFSGHGVYDSENPERSAWLLSDGPLWASELRNTLAWCASPPWLIYANACEAGMDGARVERYRGEVFGLATACIHEGVSAYIAPLWPIGDETACLMATRFYQSLLLGRSTLASALLSARREARAVSERERERGRIADISWASVVLYGDPCDRLFDLLEQ